MAADHADDFDAMTQRQLGSNGRRCARAHADGHIGYIHVRHGFKKLPPIGCHAANQVWVKAGHHVRVALVGQVDGEFTRCLKVVTVFNQRHTQCTHGGILFN